MGIRKTLEKRELAGLLERINEVLDDVHCPNTGSMTQMQLCNCVKPEVNAFLDAARSRFNQLSEDLQQHREEFEQAAHLPAAKLVHSKPYGWHITFKRALLSTGDLSGGKRRKLAMSTSERSPQLPAHTRKTSACLELLFAHNPSRGAACPSHQG